MAMLSSYSGDDIRRNAPTCWLTPEWIESILLNPLAYGFALSTEPPSNPQNGDLYVFDRRAVKSFKHDGVNWEKKKNEDRIQEVYQTIKIDGVERITGFYSKSADNNCFRKRIYRLYEPGSPIFLVHYRDYAVSSGSKLLSSSRSSRGLPLPPMIGAGITLDSVAYLQAGQITKDDLDMDEADTGIWSQPGYDDPSISPNKDDGDDSPLRHALNDDALLDSDVSEFFLSSWCDDDDPQMTVDTTGDTMGGDCTANNSHTQAMSSPSQPTSSPLYHPPQQHVTFPAPVRVKTELQTSAANASSTATTAAPAIQHEDAPTSSHHQYFLKAEVDPRDPLLLQQQYPWPTPPRVATHTTISSGYIGNNTGIPGNPAFTYPYPGYGLNNTGVPGSGSNSTSGTHDDHHDHLLSYSTHATHQTSSSSNTSGATSASSSYYSIPTACTDDTAVTQLGTPALLGAAAIPSIIGIGSIGIGHFQPLTAIIDFSPTEDYCSGGVKVLVCLASPLPSDIMHSPSLQVSFGGTTVPAEVLSSTVLRCRSPPRIVGRCSICLATLEGRMLSPPTEQLFEYKASASLASPTSTFSSSSSSAAYGASGNRGEAGLNFLNNHHVPPYVPLSQQQHPQQQYQHHQQLYSGGHGGVVSGGNQWNPAGNTSSASSSGNMIGGGYYPPPSQILHPPTNPGNIYYNNDFTSPDGSTQPLTLLLSSSSSLTPTAALTSAGGIDDHDTTTDSSLPMNPQLVQITLPSLASQVGRLLGQGKRRMVTSNDGLVAPGGAGGDGREENMMMMVMDDGRVVSSTASTAMAASTSLRLINNNMPQHSNNIRGDNRDNRDNNNRDNREHKIRIVERLSNVSSALQSDSSSFTTINSTNNNILDTNSAGLDTTTPFAAAAAALTTVVGMPSAVGTTSGCGSGSSESIESSSEQQESEGLSESLSARSRSLTVASSGSSGTMTDYAVPGGGGGAGSDLAEQWLDDAQLALMSTSDLEKLTERYLMSVVKQLVQLASVDEDLRTELDALDSSGLSLLHYCCLYNLTALVPVLLARGASVEQRTALPTIGEVDESLPTVDSTALHLASSAGHLAIVQILVECGADLLATDAEGLKPADRALHGARHDVLDYLIQVARTRNIPSAIPNVALFFGDSTNNSMKGGGIQASSSSSSFTAAAAAVHGGSVIKETTAGVRVVAGSEDIRSSAIAALLVQDEDAEDNHNHLLASGHHHHHQHSILPSAASISFIPASSSNPTSPTSSSSIGFTPPPPHQPSPVLASRSQQQRGGRSSGAPGLSNLLLQEAFSSLSLADKCALSVSLSRQQQQQQQQGAAALLVSSQSRSTPPASGQRRFSTGSKQLSAGDSPITTSQGDTSPAFALKFSRSYSNGSDSAAGGAGGSTAAGDYQDYSSVVSESGTDNDYELDLDLEAMTIHSVISESDKESLDVAMSMMGQKELLIVEDEVRRIQNNVRGWLLRKNYINLREAARTLQVAWRERKRGHGSISPLQLQLQPHQIFTTAAGILVRGCATESSSSSGGGAVVVSNAYSSSSSSSSSSIMPSSSLSRPAQVLIAGSASSSLSTIAAHQYQVSNSLSSGRAYAILNSNNTSSSSSRISVEKKENYNKNKNPLAMDDDNGEYDENAGVTGAAGTYGAEQHSSSAQHLTNKEEDSITGEGVDEEAPTDRELEAAATLQAATRAMIARKKDFANAKKQALASLVIQKSLLQWWVQKDREEQDQEQEQKMLLKTQGSMHSGSIHSI